MLGEAKIVFKNRRSLCGAGISEAGAAETDGGKIGSAGCALLLGGFDGLHKGHETLLAAAKQTGLKVAAIAITGGKGAPIYTEAERDYIFAENGISAVYPLKFAAIRDMSAAEFACAVRDEIAPEVCFCGEDFRFGSGGKANGDDFARLSGVPVRVLPVLKDAATGEKIGAEHIKALLKNGDVIFCDTGTTTQCFCAELVCRIKREGLNVKLYTNSLANLELLSPYMPVTLIGGEYRPNRKDFCGYLTDQALTGLYFSKSFVGADGCVHGRQFTTTDFDTARMNQIAMRNTDQNIMLVDSSKFSVSAHVAYAPLEMLHTIVTDTGIRPEMLAQLKSSHVRVICADVSKPSADET